jgi:hypothetical protein
LTGSRGRHRDTTAWPPGALPQSEDGRNGTRPPVRRDPEGGPRFGKPSRISRSASMVR